MYSKNAVVLCRFIVFITLGVPPPQRFLLILSPPRIGFLCDLEKISEDERLYPLPLLSLAPTTMYSIGNNTTLCPEIFI